jgi:hypothetical protein
VGILRIDPAAPGANVRRRERGVEGSPRARLERAIACFDASDAARVVAGLTRTLGQPSVSIGAAAGSPSQVRITVAWELTWYQWGVDLAATKRPVNELGRGSEISQLDRSARQWNASAGPRGKLRLGVPPARRAPNRGSAR